MKITNYIKARKQAIALFERTRTYENQLRVTHAAEYQLRWVVRYHVLVDSGDYSWIDRFGRPKSRKEFINLCNRALDETEYVWRVMCCYDNDKQYFDNRTFIKRLRFSAQHFPLLFHIMFVPHLRFLRKPVVLRSHL